MFVVDTLAHLAAVASHRATSAESTSAMRALESAADTWSRLRDCLMNGFTPARGKVETALRRADEECSDGMPEFTAMADELLDELYG